MIIDFKHRCHNAQLVSEKIVLIAHLLSIISDRTKGIKCLKTKLHLSVRLLNLQAGELLTRFCLGPLMRYQTVSLPHPVISNH